MSFNLFGGDEENTIPDFGTSAAPSIDTSSLGSGASVSDLIAALRAVQAEDQSKAIAANDSLKAAHNYTPEQSIGAAILGLAPILFGGALGGKKGAYSGAVGGLAGLEGYEKKIEKDNERTDKATEALARIYSANSNSALSKIFSLQGQSALQDKAFKNKEQFAAEHPTNQNSPSNILLDDSQKAAIRQELKDLGMPDEKADAMKLDTMADANLAGKQVDWKLQGKRAEISQTNSENNSTAEGRRGDQFQLKKDQLTIPGYEWISDKAPSDDNHKKAVTLDLNTKEVLASVQALKKSVSQNGQSYFGKDSLQQLVEMKVLMNTLRNLTGSGANYTDLEMKLNKVIELAPDVGLGTALANAFRGRDPLDAMDIFEGIMRRNHQIGMTTYGFQPAPRVISDPAQFNALKRTYGGQ